MYDQGQATVCEVLEVRDDYKGSGSRIIEATGSVHPLTRGELWIRDNPARACVVQWTNEMD